MQKQVRTDNATGLPTEKTTEGFGVWFVDPEDPLFRQFDFGKPCNKCLDAKFPKDRHSICEFMINDKLQQIRFDDGSFPAYAFPGGYPIYYLTHDNAVLCPSCVNEHRTQNLYDFKPVNFDVNYEDQNLYCEHCNKQIEAAYTD